VDSSEVDALMRALEPAPVDKALRAARTQAGRAAGRIVKTAAPRGKSERAGPYYRRHGLGHGTFAASVRARAIKRGARQGIRGVVIGPMGKQAFTRHWIAFGTKEHLIPPRRGVSSIASLALGRSSFRRHPGQAAQPWLDGAAGPAIDAAEAAAVKVFHRYIDTLRAPEEGTL
jgi:hypothetical protein